MRCLRSVLECEAADQAAGLLGEVIGAVPHREKIRVHLVARRGLEDSNMVAKERDRQEIGTDCKIWKV
jgi:hypothetical protein